MEQRRASLWIASSFDSRLSSRLDGLFQLPGPDTCSRRAVAGEEKQQPISDDTLAPASQLLRESAVEHGVCAQRQTLAEFLRRSFFILPACTRGNHLSDPSVKYHGQATLSVCVVTVVDVADVVQCLAQPPCAVSAGHKSGQIAARRSLHSAASAAPEVLFCPCCSGPNGNLGGCFRRAACGAGSALPCARRTSS